ncbi:MAG: zinc ribbon domain-containing protein [Thermoleophilia bacterium]|nr:zinc ribbon domain-containing protein [Thermoleophilia bacterium]
MAKRLFGILGPGPVLMLLLVMSVALLFGQTTGVVAAPPPLTHGWTQVVEGGFTDPGNSHAPFFAEFKGYLYLSTMSSEAGQLYAGSDKLGGDIWRTADGLEWEQIGTAGFGNPRNTMFDLVVFKDELYALSYNLNDHGLEIWVTSNGTEFTQVEKGGFGDPNSDHATPLVLDGRLVLGVGNSKTGVQIWVSDDGRSFRQVVSGGLGASGTTGMLRRVDPTDPQPMFQDKLYVGISNPASGGEIWRTVDGLEWERVADKGLGRAKSASLDPDLVYQDRLYAFGYGGGTLDQIAGFELFRSEDGSSWERVVENGFDVGKERNVQGDLVEFKGRLYLTSSNMDPRVLVPGNSMERLAPQGFQLRVSDDGTAWTQVGKDGFGFDSSLIAGTNVFDDAAYLEAYDYHLGSGLWKSTDGQRWQLIFQEPEPSFFHQGGGVLDFKGHFLWISNDLKNGVEIWRTDEVMVAEATTTTLASGTTDTTGATGTTGTTLGGSTTTVPAGGSTGSGEDSGGLSGGILALIIALAVVAAAAIGVATYLLGKARGRANGSAAPSSTAPPSGSGFCSQCGSAVNPGSTFCAGCGKKL